MRRGSRLEAACCECCRSAAATNKNILSISTEQCMNADGGHRYR